METAELMPKESAAVQTPETAFAEIVKAAQTQIEESKKVVVTDPTDLRGMAESKRYRLALVKIRTRGDAEHKRLKENILVQGRALDGAKNMLIAMLKPEEDRLKEQEEIAERLQAKRDAELREKRTAELVALGEEPQFHGPFETFPADEWARKIEGLTVAKNAREEAAKKAAEAEAARIKAEREEQERIRAENARLKVEADAREAAMRAEREQAEKARREAEAAAKAERDAVEQAARVEAARVAEIARKEREAIEAKAKAEREAAAAESAKLAQEAAQARAALEAKQRAEREQAQAEEAARRKAEAAPDREKLEAFAYAVAEMKLPPMDSLEGRKVRHEIEDKAVAFAAWIRQQAEKL